MVIIVIMTLRTTCFYVIENYKHHKKCKTPLFLMAPKIALLIKK